MENHPTRGETLTRFYELTEARRERERREHVAVFYRRLVAAASIDLSKLSTQAQRILRWLAEWDDWTTSGLVEILTAARTAGRDKATLPTADAAEPVGLTAALDEHRERFEHERAEFRDSQARFDTAIARCDAQWSRPATAPKVEGPSL